MYRCRVCKLKQPGFPKHPPHLVCEKCFPDFYADFWKKEKLRKDKAEAKLIAEKEKREKDILKAKLKTLSEYEAEARKVFQQWIRQRDEKLPCISCGTMTAKQWDGGHFYKAEIYSGMIFDEMNCSKQCSWCNDYHSGNLLEYRKGLIHRYGQAYVDTLDAKSNGARKYTYTREELTEIKKKYSERLRKKAA